jgi:hypothetical protein
LICSKPIAKNRLLTGEPSWKAVCSLDQVHQIISHALAERKLEPAPPTKAEAMETSARTAQKNNLRERENALFLKEASGRSQLTSI